MRNLKEYDEDSFEYYESILKSKKNSEKDPDYKERVLGYNDTIEEKFEDYDNSFSDNNLVSLNNHGFNSDEKEDLLKLYSYKSKLIQKLKVTITTTASNRILNTCQNCTIGEVNSFDHFIPKNEFPEFSVHPKNLFPSCTTCNSYKGEKWRESRDLKFLNLYLDELPEVQYLFVDVNVDIEGVVNANFYLDNINGINPDLFDRISFHYTKLHLCKRFKENIDSVIMPLENSIKINSKNLSIDEIINTVIEVSEENMLFFGHNYWKSILEIALVQNDDFIKSLNL